MFCSDCSNMEINLQKIFILQWNLYSGYHGENQSVLIRGVASFQGVKFY